MVSAPSGHRAHGTDPVAASHGTFGVTATVSGTLLLVSAVLAGTGLLDPDPTQLVDDLGQLVGGAFAAGCCIVTSRRAARTGRGAPAWLWRLLLGLGMLGWTFGQAVWTWYQLIGHRAIPSPSLADVGYFALPVLALPALLVMPPGPARRDPAADGGARPPGSGRRGRALLTLDAVAIAGSLLLLTWSTALGAVVRAGAPTTAAFLIAVAYPVTDVVLVVIVLLLALLRRPRRPLALMLLGAGLIALSASDSFFLYVVSIGADDMPPVYDVGFLAGPVLIGLAALAPEPSGRRSRTGDGGEITWYTLLPYLPLGLIALLVGVQEAMGVGVSSTESAGLVLLAIVVVGRQLLTVLENLDLLRRVRDGQERLHHQAFHDALTGLPNRALFTERLERAVEEHGARSRPLALLFCDVDDFKGVNDGFGHPAGDHLLRITAERLVAHLGPGDIAARLGGDEFAAILVSPGDPVAAGRELIGAIGSPVTLAGRPHLPRVSAGLVVVRGDEAPVTSSVVLHRADAAMYAAKRGGKGRLVVYRPELDPEARHDVSVSVVRALARTLAENRLPFGVVPGAQEGPVRLAYQPIVRLSDGAVVAVEALLRWQHAASGPVPPDVLVHLAETATLLAPLEEYVLDLACRDVAALRGALGAGLAVHVNLTAAHVTRDTLVERTGRALERHGLPGDALVLEVTETDRITDLTAAAGVLDDVRALGVRLALDDFGAGNSNLDYLLQLPIDILKLDRALVAGDGSARAEAVSSGAVQIARGLDIPVIAEGVEQPAQAARLAALGCEYAQGYLYARPLTLAEVVRRARADDGMPDGIPASARPIRTR